MKFLCKITFKDNEEEKQFAFSHLSSFADFIDSNFKVSLIDNVIIKFF